MTPDDLGRFSDLSDPRMHPDGIRVAFTVSRMELEDDRYRRGIWLWDGGEARSFTQGRHDTAPRWSPDGRRLGFLRKGPEADDRAQLAVMAADGGEAVVLTDFPLGVEEMEWSPDGRWLAVVGVDWTEEWAGLDEEERGRRPRRVTRPPWRADDRGWVHDRRRHVYLVDPEGDEEPRLLTPGDFDEGAIAWRPDGRAVAFLSARHPQRGLEPGVQPFEVDVEGAEVRPLAELGDWRLVTYRADGVPHLVGQPDRWDFPAVASVWRRDGDGAWTDLTGHLDRSVVFFSVTVSPPGPRWVGSDFVTTLEDRGRVRVVRIDPEGRATELVGGDRVVLGADPRADGALAFVATTPTDPGELWWWEGGEERVLTAINESFRKEVALVEPEAFTVTSGEVEVDAWAYLPPGEQGLPVLVNIHGGPASQYGYRFFDEFQVYAGAGYAVVACNPRGSSGRGREFVRAVTGEGWGTVDRADVGAVVDEALRRFPSLDPERLGVMGGSYGGFLTGWLIGHDPRFASAVVERGLLAWPSFSGTSDIGPWFSRLYLGATLPEDVETLYRASPVAVAHQVRTPTLVLHSEEDFRCPIEQAEQLFVLLKQAGVETEMVRFPGESHELSRSGRPRHRRERLEIILDWHARHLQSDLPT